MKTSKISSIIAVCVTASCLFAFAPAASAADDSVTSTRSFPSVTEVRKDLTVESTSTQVEEDSDWGSIESLDVPQTKSQAEKDAEAKQKAAEEAKAAAAKKAQAASRSSSRSSTAATQSYVDAGSSASAGAAASVDRAYALVGRAMD